MSWKGLHPFHVIQVEPGVGKRTFYTMHYVGL